MESYISTLEEGVNIQVYIYNQYIETNMMHILFNLLRIKGLYMFRALLAHSQEALLEWKSNPDAAN
jgi:hypothetical protein